MLNKVLLIGNFGSDPVLRRTENKDVPVCNISIATKETWSEQGEKKERVEWHRLVFWRRNAEIVCDHMKKGSKVWIEGKLQTRTFTKDGDEKQVTEIIVDKILMLGGGGSSNGNIR